MKLLEQLKSVVSKHIPASDSTSKPHKPADDVTEPPRTKRDYTLKRAQNRKNTKGASAKGNVPGRRK